MRKLHPKVERLFKDRFPNPTEIQEKAFSSVSSGNILITAPTGYGKTEAAMIPILSEIVERNPPSITLLYITPLRALNRDIFDRVFWWAEKLGMSIAIRHGDTSQSDRAKQSKNPPKILVTTPETLQSILPAKKMGGYLANVKWVVIDELHELLESKRGSQLALALRRLALRANFKVIALSATIGDPKLAADFVGAGSIIRLEKQRKMDVTVESPKPDKGDRSVAVRLGLHPSTVARLRRIHELVEEQGSVLTFVNTRSMAELLSSRYVAWDKTHKISVHHSSLSRDVRVLAEKKFKDGRIKGLIATSSLELGIDIGSIDLVIQYMSPRQVTRLVQRVGRSGHSATRVPKGVIISGNEEDALEAGVIANLAKKGKLEPVTIPPKPLDVLAHQLVGLSLDIGRVKLDTAYNLFKAAYPYRNLEWDEFMSVLKALDNERLVWLNKDDYRARRNAFPYYFSNLSTIPDERKLWVKNRLTGKNVGVLDDIFVSDNLYIGAVFITRGAPWRVIDITEKEVLVEPSSDFTAAIPDWIGEEIPVSKQVANEVSAKWKDPPREIVDRKSIVKLSSKFQFIPSPTSIYIEEVPGTTVIHCPYGTKINETIAEIIAGYSSLIHGRTVIKRVDAYRISLNLRADMVVSTLNEVNPDNIVYMLSSYLSRSSSFKSRFINVAKRFGLLSRNVDYARVGISKLVSAMVDSPIYEEATKEVFFDKMDLPGATRLIKDIQSGRVSVSVIKRKRLSELAGFTSSSSSLVLAERPMEEIYDMVLDRLENTFIGLECLNCGKMMYRRVKDYPDRITCKCGGKMFSPPEYKGKERLKAANLISQYGKLALLALAGRGVGPNTAARILSRARDKERLVKLVIEAERNFARTHRFWKP